MTLSVSHRHLFFLGPGLRLEPLLRLLLHLMLMLAFLLHTPMRLVQMANQQNREFHVINSYWSTERVELSHSLGKEAALQSGATTCQITGCSQSGCLSSAQASDFIDIPGA